MNPNPSIKNAVLFFAMGLLLGLFLSYLWSSLLVPAYKPPIDVVTPQELIKEATTSDEIYAKRLDSLHTNSQKLIGEITATKIAMEKAKAKSKELESQVRRALIKEVVHQRTDTVAVSASCDSLQVLVPELLSAISLKDSLMDTVTLNYDWQLKNKDSTIQIKEGAYQDLQLLFTKSIDSEKGLLQENTALQKTLKQHQTKNKLVSTAIFIFSGFAGAYLLHH